MQEQQSTRFVHYVKVTNQLTYATNFCLIVSDVPWDEEALMEKFHYGIRSDVKDFLPPLEDPKSLTETTSQVIRCDNNFLSDDVYNNNK